LIALIIWYLGIPDNNTKNSGHYHPQDNLSLTNAAIPPDRPPPTGTAVHRHQPLSSSATTIETVSAPQGQCYFSTDRTDK